MTSPIQTIGIKFDVGDLNRGVQASTKQLDQLGTSAKKTGVDVDAMIARMKATNLAQIEAAEGAGRAGGALRDLGGEAAAAAGKTGLMSGALGLLARGGTIIIAVETGMRAIGAAYEYVAKKSIDLEEANKKASDSLRAQADRDIPALAKAYLALNATLDRQVELREKVALLDKVASASNRIGSLVGGIFPTVGAGIRGLGGAASVVGGQTRTDLAEEERRTALANRAASEAQLGKDADLLRTFATARTLGIETVALTTQAGAASARLRAITADVTETVDRRTAAQLALNLLIEKQTKAETAAAREAKQHKDAITQILEAQERQVVTTTQGANAWALYELKLNGATAAQIDQYVALASALDQYKTFETQFKKVTGLLDAANPGRLTPTVRGDNSRGLYNPVTETGPVIGAATKKSADYFTNVWQNAALDVGRTLTDVFTGFFDSSQTALDNLISGFQRISSMLLDAAISFGIKSLLGGSGGGSGFGGGSFNVAHSGGMVGSFAMSRTVDPMAFVGAQRYHSGGMVGLSSDEVPAILQRGERVLSRSEVASGSGGVVVQQTIQLNVSALDPMTARDLVLQQMPAIQDAIGRAAERSSVYATRLRGGR